MITARSRHRRIVALVPVVVLVAIPVYWLVWAWTTPGCEGMHHSDFPACYNDHDYSGTKVNSSKGYDPEPPPYWPF